MKTVFVALALAGSASAFIAPMANVRATASSRSMSMSSSMDQPMTRAEVLNHVFSAGAVAAVAAAVLPSAANADGAKSLATQARARGIYGGRCEALAGAVAKGDTAAVLAEKNAFTLFVSGAYSTAKSKQAEALKLANDVISAAEAGDAAALKTSYAAFMKYTEQKSGFKGAGDGQGFGSEFDYKNRTPLGTVYQR